MGGRIVLAAGVLALIFLVAPSSLVAQAQTRTLAPAEVQRAVAPAPSPTPAPTATPVPGGNFNAIPTTPPTAQRWIRDNELGVFAALLYETAKGIANSIRYRGGDPSGPAQSIVPVRAESTLPLARCTPAWHGQTATTGFSLSDLAYRIPYELTSCFGALQGMLAAMTLVATGLWVVLVIYGIIRLYASRFGFSFNIQSFATRALAGAALILFAGAAFTWAIGIANDIPNVLHLGGSTPAILDLFRSDQVEASPAHPELNLAYVLGLMVYAVGLFALTGAFIVRIVLLDALFVLSPIALYLMIYDETRAYGKQWLGSLVGILVSVPVVALVLDAAGSLLAVSASGTYLIPADVQLGVAGFLCLVASGLVFSFILQNAGGLMETMRTGAAPAAPGGMFGLLGGMLKLPGLGRRAGEPTGVEQLVRPSDGEYGVPRSGRAGASAVSPRAAAPPGAAFAAARARRLPAVEASASPSSTTLYDPRPYRSRNVAHRIAAHHGVGAKVRSLGGRVAHLADESLAGGAVGAAAEGVRKVRQYTHELRQEERQEQTSFDRRERMSATFAQMLRKAGVAGDTIDPLDEQEERALRRFAATARSDEKVERSVRDRAESALHRRGLQLGAQELEEFTEALVFETDLGARREARRRRSRFRLSSPSAAGDLDAAAEVYLQFDPKARQDIRDFVETASPSRDERRNIAIYAKEMGLGQMTEREAPSVLRRVIAAASELGDREGETA